MSSDFHQLAIATTVLFVTSCGLDPSAKDRCGTSADCNPGRVCNGGVCDNGDSGTTGCGSRDFDCDGHNDLLWYQAATGETQVWYMDGVQHLADAALDLTEALDPSTGWRLAGVGDFNRDGHPDLVAREGTGGVTAIWYMNGTSRTGVEALDPALNLTDDTGWSLAGVCDFNQDGWPDLLWHHAEYGATQLWYMHGAVRGAYANLDGVSTSVTEASGWQPVGTGDFNHDGKPDILWRGTTNSQAMVWIMDGFTLRSSYTISSFLDLPQTMTLSETDDLDLDGSSDLVWWSWTTGTIDIWRMNGTSRTTQSAIDGAPDTPGWTIVPH